ncbi:hypothetical protein B0H17DRAFT_1197165 [Mycena rosella]|uniref:DUF6533 domain-containing protein n=1 Tax=Mycena rosella TaxID=1033263 RepID=A0AAD7DS73_MYCRO|nr:hypothetical protein B0H17DRAFT_1197165 [Mycena rosella]
MDVASEVSQIIFENHLHIVGISFLYWDHFLTLNTEIHFLWTRRKFASAYSFFIIRYGAFLINIPGLVTLFLTLPTNVFVLLRLGFQCLFKTPSQLHFMEHCLRDCDTRSSVSNLCCYVPAHVRPLSPKQASSVESGGHRDMLDDNCSGAAYFAVMLLSNLANMMTFITNTPVLPGSLATFANW